MTQHQRQLLRTAVKLANLLTAETPSGAPFDLPAVEIQDLKRRHRQLMLARQHRYLGAEQRVARSLRSSLLDLSRRLEVLVFNWDQQRKTSPKAISLRDLYHDLVALEAEFAEVRCDLAARTVSVVTEPITLGDIELGPFEIRLNWNALSDINRSPYKVIALEPNPANRSSLITHPHVQNGVLCEGEGHLVIQSALQEGRLFDFFTIVANVLRTYNPGSPHVSLESWDGISCGDCGCLTDEEDISACEFCGLVTCDMCTGCCQGCDTCACSSCLNDCEECHAACCHHCQVPCGTCERSCCSDCLDAEERCSLCQLEPSESETTHKETNSSTNPETTAKIQPDRLGQAPVPA
ncbi:hypothetical protein [Calycomorphotria hydatis]|uniref:Uncharacterized protein n=1 Tax=Calycomorphotria hydatis TaxID=2528027 RepID=A0A517T5G2_9PLAN|nr:hypothetical protein [Calycomorphotria hydatis]QDT63610.1 hypothetical protein V22_08340 [Calycomorphotria hydatis]